MTKSIALFNKTFTASFARVPFEEATGSVLQRMVFFFQLLDLSYGEYCEIVNTEDSEIQPWMLRQMGN